MNAKKSRLVIAVTGAVYSGVTTVTRILEASGFERRSLSTKIKLELELREKAASGKEPLFPPEDRRKALQDIGNKGRESSLSYWFDESVKDLPVDKDIVIDGIRNYGEIERLRETFPNAYVIGVMADKDLRWSRAKTAYEGNQKSFDRDDSRDQDEETPIGQQVQKCVLDSDFMLLNNENYDSERKITVALRSILDPAILLMRGTSDVAPTSAETYMSMASTQSFASRCLKRLVGAVIVSDSGIPLSTGFNENPGSMKPCLLGNMGLCFKDEDMHGKLEKMSVYCPKCGVENMTIKSPWLCRGCKESLKIALFPSRNMEVCTAIHAEERSVKSLEGRNADGATMYVTTFPCFQCSRYIIDAGIAKIVYVEPYPVVQAWNFLADNKVTIAPFSGFMARAFHRVFANRK